jgi:membrane-bound metal-dependent hydrolase YbcI (DUF457 family)
VTHRGITHWAISIFSIFFIGILLCFYDSNFIKYSYAFYGFSLGYFFHLIGDMMTKGGINNFFFPFSSLNVVVLPRKYRFYTGSIQEVFLFLFLLVVIVVEIYFIYRGAFGVI